MTATELGLAPGALKDRVAIVTGSAAGIGLAVTNLLAQLGATVVAVDRQPQEAATAGVHLVQADLSRVDEIDDWVGRVSDDHGQVSILVNAAGVTGSPMMESTVAEWERVLRIDLIAPFALIQSVGRRLLASGTTGSIVSVGSSSASRPLPASGPYGAAKAGLESLTRGAAAELGSGGINVNLVAPGVTRTQITVDAFGGDQGIERAVLEGPLSNLLGRPSEPIDIAAVIAFLCVPASRQITGQTLHVSAGNVVAAG